MHFASELRHLPIVVSVARHSGFAPAAAALGMSPSAVSHAVRTVEDRLGEPLFARTTRSVSLTEAGMRFLASVEPALADIDKAVEGLAAERGEVTGLLRINTPRIALGMALTPILSKLAWQHPRLTVEVYSDDALVDIVERGFDAGIRRGKALQRDMIAMRLTRPFRVILVASREYLEAKGVPKTIGHNCIGIRLTGSGGIFDWELMERQKDHDGEDVGNGTGDGFDARARTCVGGRRHRLCRRTVGAPLHPRGPPQMVAAAVRRRA